MFKKISAIICVFILTLFITGCGGKNSSKSLVSNTTWVDKYDSEFVFTENRLSWYETAGKHDDNYYSGSYKFFRGEEAVKYVTTELSSYGVTRDELESLFNRSDYEKKDFVVIDANFDTYKLDGQMQEVPNPHIPWYGFIQKNDTYLDIASMNTGSYYGFTKK